MRIDRVNQFSSPWSAVASACPLRGFPIPTGLCPPAQGCEERATLGKGAKEIGNPNGVVALGRGDYRRNPVGVGVVRTWFSQGSSFLATLGFESESLWDSPFFFPALKMC